jgi:hypothetical protein
MKATQQLYRAGQSLWPDNTTRDLLHETALTAVKRCVNETRIVQHTGRE